MQYFSQLWELPQNVCIFLIIVRKKKYLTYTYKNLTFNIMFLFSDGSSIISPPENITVEDGAPYADMR